MKISGEIGTTAEYRQFTLTVEEIKINKKCKMVAMKVETYQKSVIFASCYRSPKNNNNELFFEEIKQLTSIQTKNPIWIGGDFNLPDIDWEVKSINNYQYPKQQKERFTDLIAR